VAKGTPSVRYAKSGDAHIAYTVAGEGPFDLILIPGFTSHLHQSWSPPMEHSMRRLASFSRLILFDKRGTGLSDPLADVQPLEERMEDVRAVMDAAGSEKAALFGFSEGSAMAMLFSATYPERTRSLVLWGAMARTTYAPDYEIGTPREAYEESRDELVMPYFGSGVMAEIYTPSIAYSPEFLAETAGEEVGDKVRMAQEEQAGASPGAVLKIVEMYMDIDVRHVVPLISVPTLIVHAHGDRVVNVRHGRWLADRIPGARYAELPGSDHGFWYTNPDPVLDEIEEFLTGVRPVAEADRVLATVMFTDIVDSTKRAAELGDHAWRERLDEHERRVRAELKRFRGVEIKTTGDGFLATFDGPARSVRCGRAITDAVRGVGLEARVGIHSGEIELRGSDVAGIAVHIASRVGSLAAPAEVLVSETVKGLVAGSGITFEARGEHDLKGVPDRWRLFAVVG
jgi:pimeloyl-ACP methyl ester carboxylesterase